MRLFFTGILIVTACGGFMAIPCAESGTVSIAIRLHFSDFPVVLGEQLYHSETGDSLYIDALRFYVSALELKGKNHAFFAEKNSFHLVDAEETGSQTIVLDNVPTGTYNTLCFNIGTDSLTNVSGALGGDLDPTLGMYWAWNTGYINVKMEGRSNACPTLHHAFEFHIGGYMPPHTTVRKVELPLRKLRVQKNMATKIQVNADLELFFRRVSLKTTNQVMIPSKPTFQLADVFKEIFYVESPFDK